MQVTITRTNIKNGGTTEKPWKKIGIQTKQHGDKWLGCFYNKFNAEQLDALKEGVTVDIKVTEDGQWLNFAMPTETDLLKVRVARLEEKMFGANNATQLAPPQIETDPMDIPF